MSRITDQLPQAYHRENDQEQIADALTQGSAIALDSLFLSLTNDEYRRRFLDPATADADWLDAIARWGGWGDWWDSSWSESAKRALLTQTKYIFDNRGNRDVFPVLMSAFNYDAVLKAETGWILGQTLLPAGLGGDPFDYCVEVPSTFHDASPEYANIARLISIFLPCWGDYNIKQRN